MLHITLPWMDRTREPSLTRRRTEDKKTTDMPATTYSLLGKAAFASAIAVGVYGLLLGALMTPSIQRFAIYAHKVNTLFAGDDLNKPEAFGFAKNQVTPFNLRTPDGEIIYGWHVLPLDVYARNEKSLLAEDRPHGPYEDCRETTAFRLLTTDDPEPARVVVTCTYPLCSTVK